MPGDSALDRVLVFDLVLDRLSDLLDLMDLMVQCLLDLLCLLWRNKCGVDLL